jgi:hypothetical protein
MDGARPPAPLAMSAAKATLSEGLNRLQVASVARGNGATMEEGESLVTAGMSSLAPVRGVAFRSQLNQFLPGGLDFTGGGPGGRASRGGRTILASNTLAAGGSFQILSDYKSRVTTPLTRDRVSPGNAGRGGDLMFGGLSALAFGRASGSQGMFDNKEEDDNGYPPPSGFVSTVAGVPAGEQVQHNSRGFTAQQAPIGHLLYGPHGPETRICRGVIVRGTQPHNNQ